MKTLSRILLILLGLILVIVIGLGVTAVISTRQSFPETAGTLEIPGLKDEVHVYRDEYGVAHIYANNEDDLFFAQGYVHAQDRFWQMEFWRHIGMGRISEIAGEPALEQDKFIRTVGWNRMAQNYIDYYEEEAPEFITIMENYSAGVNAYIDENRDNLSLHIKLLGLVQEPWEIEPWQPVHTVAWGIVMAWDLGGNWSAELTRARLNEELGEATVATLLPGYPYDTRPVIAPSDEMEDEFEDEETAVSTPLNWSRINTNIIGEVPDTGFAFGRGIGVGSNNWVISGEHTESGLPLLANDPHLGVQMPAIWYEVGLHAPGWNVVGFSFAGVPGVIVGHNNRIAWGVTNVAPDIQDLYIEKVNPSDPNQYEFEGEWRDMDVIQETIQVNGGEDVTLNVRLTHHGPIISDVTDDADDADDPLALRWNAQEPSRALQSVILINQAQNFDEFHEALRYWDTAAQNFVYADVDGNIGYQTTGLTPIRPRSDGLLPVPGWTGEHEWEEWIPYEDLPTVYNPEKGYIVTANHAVVDPEYPYHLAFDWADGDRGLRIHNMIEAEIKNGRALTADAVADMHFDSKSLPAETFIPLLDDLSSDDPQVQAALERMRGWQDYQERPDSVPAAIFEVFYVNLMQNIFADEVGEENVFTLTGRDIFMYDLAEQPNATWWDNVNTDPTETQDDILLQSVADAVAWLEEELGDDMNAWTWGSIHTITFTDEVLGASGIAPIEAIFNRGPFPVAGGRDLVNANNWSYNNPAIVRAHPSMRMIVDMSNFDAGLSVIPTGNSGHPYNPHYDDQMPLWLNGEYHPMLFSREAVENAAADHLVLQPTP